MAQSISDTAGDVHIGLENYLFLAGGQHGVFSYFTGARSPSERSLNNFRDNLVTRARFCTDTGRRFLQVIFPEKCVALKDFVAIEDPIQSLFARCYESTVPNSLKSAMVYPLSVLENNLNAFTKTDTHYSQRGNVILTEALLAGLAPDEAAALPSLAKDVFRVESNYSGDLGRKLDPPHTEEAELFNRKIVPIHTGTNGIRGGNEGICVLVESPEAMTDKKLIIFGDSFFRQMLPVLAVIYRRIVFCRTRFFHYEMVDAFEPDDIMCGIAERYLSNCYPDATRPHFLAYPLLTTRAMEPDQVFTELWPKFFSMEKML